MKQRLSLSLAVFGLLLGSTAGYAPSNAGHRRGHKVIEKAKNRMPFSSSSSPSSTILFGNTKQPPVLPVPRLLTYGEKSRQYRR
eukprot:CAMPEP_0176020650 /NCGR_PEP_ID=MMETSP0120_2-20121206/10009_1 /TAXON_ID=160619 /ORGANISM="Kryptoperidinium foliaceum, Strain CCMP 1326" /LENGTH=83 /DNA_ID=CAMNT_0017353751 /DNA_START=27 /DNA_END=274 /DNA_ORIENTATION=-